jgi:hypothetical protein
MAKVLLGVAATGVMVVGGVMDPGRRYVYLLFTLLGLIFTFRAFIAWEEKRRGTMGGSS